jgi:hypothetical protein
MDYNKLIETISEVVNNEKILKTNLTLVYELPEKLHEQMDEELFYKTKNDNTQFQHKNEIELEVSNLKIKLVKKIV